MFSETQRLASTGASLAYHHDEAVGPARGILLISHGLAEHSKRYRAFAEAMAARGYHVYAHDHRGHGETTAPDAPVGRFARRGGVDRVIGDVLAMRAHAAMRHPGLPVILFGHSMGGLIALNAAVTAPADFNAVAVWNSNFAVGLAGRAAQAILLAERMLKGSDVPSGLLPKLTFTAWGKSIAGRRTEFDWLSRLPGEVDKYVADPLCGFDASVSLWLDLFEMTFRAPQKLHLDRLPRDLPIHLVGGGEDPATERGKAVLWLSNHLKACGFSRISTEIYQDMRHETLNEIGADAATAAFADWCDEALARFQTARS
ncbi:MULTISPECIES: alpha/beta fold hydrolase [Rhizobium]|uniref:alpha/beta fold hydrolase n=1 Tax=Rhizobium TaxID=379 RepID=UPI000BEACC85|nr:MULTISPECIES: alpha/beta hydrolase [Rhizobium]MBY4587936.1 alpha/beta hydrolase [Rhizobium redzepovicii]MDF0659333.1 alpha/beta hydrolase [Rhizobium sp. BC49]PDS83156.1 alpha/beta hydrolase [Rhizobium sp. L18]TBY45514.1 alpha/beta hydrolase [Rhizobium leguminosarum bv. viciae]ULJ79223.1 alpha/beta hydrolase [Rhizobium sp. C104]